VDRRPQVESGWVEILYNPYQGLKQLNFRFLLYNFSVEIFCNPVRAGGLCLCSSDFNRLLLLCRDVACNVSTTLIQQALVIPLLVPSAESSASSPQQFDFAFQENPLPYTPASEVRYRRDAITPNFLRINRV